MSVTRRTTFAAALAAPALLAATSIPAAAQAPATRQAPGFYRFKVGTFEVTVINDGYNRRPNPAEGFIRNADAAAVRGALEAALLPTDHLDIPFNITVVNTGSDLILFDTGTGGLLAPTAGTMWDNLAAAGIDPAAITKIVFTHFHGDHVSGLVTREGQARFPRAELIVPEAEWAFWMGDRAPQQPATMVKGRFGAYPAERVKRIASNAEVVTGVTGVATHGHTPGHTCYTVANGNASILVLGDVTNHPVVNVTNVGWHAVFDMDANQAEATRRALFDRAAADRTLIIGYHWPFPSLGRVRRTGNGYDIIAQPWTTAL